MEANQNYIDRMIREKEFLKRNKKYLKKVKTVTHIVYNKNKKFFKECCYDKEDLVQEVTFYAWKELEKREALEKETTGALMCLFTRYVIKRIIKNKFKKNIVVTEQDGIKTNIPLKSLGEINTKKRDYQIHDKLIKQDAEFIVNKYCSSDEEENIIMMRLEGYNLKDIAKLTTKTRMGVLFIINKFFNSLSDFKESVT